MESESSSSSTDHKQNSSGTVVAIIVVIIILIVLAAGFFWYHSRKVASQTAMMRSYGNMHTSGMPMKDNAKGHMKMNMTAQPTPTLSAQQNQELTSGTATDTTQKTFDIKGGDFYFAPNKITVNKGDKVTFVLHNDGGFHNINIDEFGVKSDTITTGKTTTVTFTADKSGSFIYYCSVPGHRQKGMWGTLVVK